MTSYQDLHRAYREDIEAEVTANLALVGGSSPGVRDAVDQLLRHQQMKYPLSVLPLLVHGAESGSPEPALPLSAVHALWWASACYLDDLADGNGATSPAALDAHQALVAAIVTGHVLPLRALGSKRIPEAVRPALAAEILNCGIKAAEGQLGDMRKDVGGMTRDSVVAAYRGKSGAPFGMITAMAATLSGAGDERVGVWREFGYVFGVLWQIFNDQEDITSGRNEDLRNGTVTYLLMCALEEASSATRRRILDLHTTARTSAGARSALTDLLLSPSVLTPYEKDVNEFRDEAHRLLSEAGGDEVYVSILRQLVDQTSRLLL